MARSKQEGARRGARMEPGDSAIKDVVHPVMAGEERNASGNGPSGMDANNWATKQAELPLRESLGTAGCSAHQIVSQLNNQREKHVETATASSTASILGDRNLLDNPGIPFAKTSPAWKHVESLNVFQIIPQKPHFKPLVECKGMLREGFAIGYMVSFASLVEEISTLRVGDPVDTFNKYLEALSDLGNLGFEVKAPEDCVKKLLSVKIRREELLLESRNAYNQISECTNEKIRLEANIHAMALKKCKLKEDVDALNKKISELEEKAVQEESMKEKKDSEIST